MIRIDEIFKIIKTHQDKITAEKDLLSHEKLLIQVTLHGLQIDFLNLYNDKINDMKEEVRSE